MINPGPIERVSLSEVYASHRSRTTAAPECGLARALNSFEQISTGVIARSASRDDAIPTGRGLAGPRLLRFARNDPDGGSRSDRNLR